MTLKQLRESFYTKFSTRNVMVGKPESLDKEDHQVAIDRIKNAMKKYPSGDPKIEADQLARIEMHTKKLKENS